MTGIEPPREPVAPPPLVQPITYAQPRQRNWWPVIIVGGILALIVTGVAGFAISAGVAYLTDSADRRAAEQAVIALDEAYRDADCEAFEAVTTSRARDTIIGADYDCGLFEEAAAALQVDGEYDYAVEIVRSVKRDDRVIVTTREALSGASKVRYSYVVQKSDGGWLIRAYGQS